MITLLTILVSGLINALPLFTKLFGAYMDIKKEIRLKEMEIELEKANLATRLDISKVIADLREGESLRNHDNTIDDRGFIGGLRASVRPVVTYVFFALFFAVKGAAIYHVVTVGGLGFTEAMPLIWDESTQAIFGAVCGFWFGGRAIEKFGYNRRL